MKSARQLKIMEIIRGRDVGTQNELLRELRSAGFFCTQATVSRDIKELHLSKELTPGGGYRYAYASGARDSGRGEKLKTIFRESVTSFDCAQNIVVLKTLPGLASAACSAIDGMHIPDLVGTLAGDDTAFLAMRSNGSAERFCEEISDML